MHHQQVTSSNIRSIGYDASSTLLEVTFTDGSTYRYQAVPVEVHAQFIKATSHGKYFHAHIRDHYATLRVS
ncbi:KTSC domain-containing protein [Lentzea sp. NPDC092896]|uniref:KTSC domain-containing protein n=1 Tax=Lentzea sp. NPDC092896 TaxID=3364127 RepID=UPI0038040C7E